MTTVGNPVLNSKAHAPEQKTLAVTLSCPHPVPKFQLTGAKDPAALERLVKATGAKPENVNR